MSRNWKRQMRQIGIAKKLWQRHRIAFMRNHLVWWMWDLDTSQHSIELTLRYYLWKLQENRHGEQTAAISNADVHLLSQQFSSLPNFQTNRQVCLICVAESHQRTKPKEFLHLFRQSRSSWHWRWRTKPWLVTSQTLPFQKISQSCNLISQLAVVVATKWPAMRGSKQSIVILSTLFDRHSNQYWLVLIINTKFDRNLKTNTVLQHLPNGDRFKKRVFITE